MAQHVLSEIAYGSAAYEATVRLRNEVLRKPLGLELTDEELSGDSSNHHLACEEEGEIVACLVLVPTNAHKVKMRQVAVASHAQSRGIGRALVQFAEEFARNHGYKSITLNARETAIPFYDRLGYETVS